MSDLKSGWDHSQAHSEGWWLFELSKPPIILSDSLTCKELPGYRATGDTRALDALARAFVQQRAREGSAYHIEALARTQLL
jgi:hypothetical protein